MGIEWGALANIVVWGVIIGAGLPALYALGVRSLQGPGSFDSHGNLLWWRRGLGYLCFAIGAAGIVAGLAFIVAGGH